jgi:hypothetical protein
MLLGAIAQARSARLLCAVLALGSACQSKLQKSALAPPDLRISAVFVYPFVFRWQEPAYRSFELSQRLIAVAIQGAGDSVMLFGPPEFKVYRPDDADPWAASNAVALLPAVQIRPESAIVLRPSAERRVFTSEKELLNAAGKTAGVTRSREVTYLCRVELLHPSSHQVIAEVNGQVAADLFASAADEADSAPELTKLMEALTSEALELVAKHFNPPARPKRWPWVFAFNPQQVFTYAEEGRPALELQLARMDPLEAEALRLSRVRYANPGLSDFQAVKMMQLPGGLWVTSAPAGTALQVGDLISSIDGAPALPQALQRARFSSAACNARVRKANGDLVDLMLP